MKTTPDPLNDPRFEPLVSQLRGQAAPEPSADFTDRTMDRIHRAPVRRWTFSEIAVRAAAAFALLLGAGLWWVRIPAPVASAPAPIDILMAAQRADGGWSSDERNLRSRYDVGVTALAVLALMRADETPHAGSPSAALRAGIAHLLSQQRADGRFGEDFSGSGFTHYLAGMALQAAARLPGASSDWILAAARAERHLPSGLQMAKLNNSLAHPETFPARWADAGGPVTLAALEMLKR